MENNEFDHDKYLRYQGVDVPDDKPAEVADVKPAEAETAPVSEHSEQPSEPHEPGPKWLTNVMLTLSAVFSPLLVPTYAFAMALWITPLAILAERSRLIISLLIFVFTSALPMAVIIFMIRMGKVSDAALSNKNERGIPYLVTAACYLVAAIFLKSIHAPHWLVFFFGGAMMATLIAVCINTVWKISAHGTVMGGLCAMLFYIGFHHYGIVAILPWISGAVILSGAVGTARVYLGRHTPAQVYAGWLLGLIVEFAAMSI